MIVHIHARTIFVVLSWQKAISVKKPSTLPNSNKLKENMRVIKNKKLSEHRELLKGHEIKCSGNKFHPWPSFKPHPQGF